MPVVKSVIFDAHLYYVKLRKPVLKFGRPDLGTPHGNREYAVDVILTKEDAKELKSRFGSVSAVKNIKVLDAEEFETKFKTSPPYEAENYYLLKMRKSADYTDGSPSPRPLLKAAARGVKLTPETEIGNGSKGHIQFKERAWNYQGTDGVSLDLKAVGITELVEYAGEDLEFETFDEYEFDDVIDDSVEDVTVSDGTEEKW